MSRHDCRRCEWRPDLDDDSAPSATQLLDHADQTRFDGDPHPLCILCGLSLPAEDPRVCLPCLADVRRDLESVVEAYALLPQAAVRVPSPSDWRRSGHGSEAPLPGGDALVMLAVGSPGGACRPDDPPAVAFELATWCEDWAGLRGEALPGLEVACSAEWLSRRAAWAGEAHDAFDEFAADVRRIRRHVQAVTALADPEDVGAGCLTCGADLRRSYAEAKPCHHERPDQGLLVVAWTTDDPPAPIRETVAERDLRLEQWAEKHAHCDQGGRGQAWHCPRCQRVHSQGEYGLAVASEMRARREDAHYWVPVATAARLVDRSQSAIKRWADDEEHPVLLACDVRTRRLRVLLASVFRANDHRRRRRRAA